MRIVVFRLFYRFLVFRNNEQSNVRKLVKDGFFVFPNFLTENEFHKVRMEYDLTMKKKLNKVDDMSSGSDIFGQRHYSVSLTDCSYSIKDCAENDSDRYSETFCNLLYNRKFQDILTSGLGLQNNSLLAKKALKAKFIKTIQVAAFGGADSLDHAHAKFHVDSFTTALRVFFFINAVDGSNGALHYVRGSNNISLDRLKKSYLDSNKNINGGSNSQIRYTSQEVRTIGEDLSLCGLENTLVVVDVSGLHKRGMVDLERTRDMVVIECSHNPFYSIRQLFRKKL